MRRPRAVHDAYAARVEPLRTKLRTARQRLAAVEVSIEAAVGNAERPARIAGLRRRREDLAGQVRRLAGEIEWLLRDY